MTNDDSSVSGGSANTVSRRDLLFGAVAAMPLLQRNTTAPSAGARSTPRPPGRDFIVEAPWALVWKE
ncbi:MAG: hypothetical protein EBS96_11450, partial [Spartobacteria bacterium]|nr:hypothetical protein [Spartobacteria bacterium]